MQVARPGFPLALSACVCDKRDKNVGDEAGLIMTALVAPQIMSLISCAPQEIRLDIALKLSQTLALDSRHQRQKGNLLARKLSLTSSSGFWASG